MPEHFAIKGLTGQQCEEISTAFQSFSDARGLGKQLPSPQFVLKVQLILRHTHGLSAEEKTALICSALLQAEPAPTIEESEESALRAIRSTIYHEQKKPVAKQSSSALLEQIADPESLRNDAVGREDETRDRKLSLIALALDKSLTADERELVIARMHQKTAFESSRDNKRFQRAMEKIAKVLLLGLSANVESGEPLKLIRKGYHLKEPKLPPSPDNKP